MPSSQARDMVASPSAVARTSLNLRHSTNPDSTIVVPYLFPPGVDPKLLVQGKPSNRSSSHASLLLVEDPDLAPVMWGKVAYLTTRACSSEQSWHAKVVFRGRLQVSGASTTSLETFVSKGLNHFPWEFHSRRPHGYHLE